MMNFLKRKTEVIEQVEPEQVQEQAAPLKSDPISYTDLIYREYNSRVKPIEEKIKDIETKQADVKKHRRKVEPPDTVEKVIEKRLLVEAAEKLYDQLKIAQMELNKIKQEYQPSSQLIDLAYKIDTADAYNEGARLTIHLYSQIKKLVPALNRASECYGGDIYTPIALIQIRESIIGIITALTENIHLLTITDKSKLISEFNEAHEEYQQGLHKKEILINEYLEAMK